MMLQKCKFCWGCEVVKGSYSKTGECGGSLVYNLR